MRKKLKTGLVQIYTGSGKGKTTAAVGLAVRAHCAGLRVCIHQFMKRSAGGELNLLKRLRGINAYQHGGGSFVRGKPKASDIRLARRGLERAALCVSSGRYDVVILDELNAALKSHLFCVSDVVEIIRSRPAHVEIVITGRNCPKALLELADLITEMKNIRHPYQSGILARRGIEF